MTVTDFSLFFTAMSGMISRLWGNTIDCVTIMTKRECVPLSMQSLANGSGMKRFDGAVDRSKVVALRAPFELRMFPAQIGRLKGSSRNEKDDMNSVRIETLLFQE